MDRFIYRERTKIKQEDQSSSFGKVFDNLLAKAILLSVSAFLLYNVIRSADITIQKLDILRNARSEVDELRLKNLELALLLETMQSKEYLEIQARDRLNFAGEKEYIFVIPQGILDESGKDMEIMLGTNQENNKEGGYQIWKDFLLTGI